MASTSAQNAEDAPQGCCKPRTSLQVKSGKINFPVMESVLSGEPQDEQSISQLDFDIWMHSSDFPIRRQRNRFRVEMCEDFTCHGMITDRLTPGRDRFFPNNETPSAVHTTVQDGVPTMALSSSDLGSTLSNEVNAHSVNTVRLALSCRRLEMAMSWKAYSSPQVVLAIAGCDVTHLVCLSHVPVFCFLTHFV